MARVHLVCCGGRHLKATNDSRTEYECGYWVLTETQVKQLMNGFVYLHEKKSQPSYFGGIICGHRLASADEPSPGQVVLTIAAKDDCKGVAWEGDAHPMAWMGGILS